ncbi:MAG TPA: hypothetical protein VMW40_07170 [Candidatus Bathyarchaeia archaeon]|nr:hypothetical protein [Candidatus Bathyarchaeia archaeon]
MIDNSDESEGDPPKKLEYRKLPSKVEELVDDERAKITRTANITFDKRQYLVRFPKEIAEELGLSTEHKVRFTLISAKTRTDEEPELTMEVVK